MQNQGEAVTKQMVVVGPHFRPTAINFPDLDT